MVYYLYIFSIDISIYIGVLYLHFVPHILVYIMVYYLYICSIDISIYHGVLSLHLFHRY